MNIVNKKVLIFGGTGGIGAGAKQAFEGDGFEVSDVGSKQLNFKTTSTDELYQFLENADPDIVVHCAGTMGIKEKDYRQVFDVNFGSVWNILSYYLEHPPKKKVSIVIVGSSSFNRPSPNYALYAASKAALVSLVSSLAITFTGTNVLLNMVNPGKTKTNMRLSAVGAEPEGSLLTPYEVGREIVKISKLEVSGIITKLDKT